MDGFISALLKRYYPHLARARASKNQREGR
jgi:hypothetical protein